MRIILDPSRDGCTIWFPDKNTLKFLNGTPLEICNRLHKFCITSYKDKFDTTVIEQWVDISLDDKGVGCFYRDYLSNSCGLTVHPIKLEKEISI